MLEGVHLIDAVHNHRLYGWTTAVASLLLFSALTGPASASSSASRQDQAAPAAVVITAADAPQPLILMSGNSGHSDQPGIIMSGSKPPLAC